MKSKNIIVFVEGNADSADTWSNIPYFLVRSLEREGVTVEKIDIGVESSSRGEKLFFFLVDLMTRGIRKLIKNNPVFSLNRTKIYDKMVKRKMKKAIEQKPDLQGAIMLNFSHSAAWFAPCPTCMLCDWPIEYLIEKHQNRNPGRLEKIAIKRQIKELLSVDYVITLFPDVQEYMQKKYNREILYLGNVINLEQMDWLEEDSKGHAEKSFFCIQEDEFFKKKQEGNHYLFIGRQRYMDSAVRLVQAIKAYNCTHKDKLYVDIVGLDKEMREEFHAEFVQCYGYLSKGDKKQKELYMQLLNQAKVLVNITEEWNGMSSLIEAMYCYIPVIIVPNPNIEKTFGKTCDFGKYCKTHAVEELIKSIEEIQRISADHYEEICYRAHRKVEAFTWSNYSKKIMALLESAD